MPVLAQTIIGYVTVTTRLAWLRSSSSLRVRLRSDLGGCNSTGDDCRRAYSCDTKVVRQDSTKHSTIKLLFITQEHRTVSVRLRHTAATRLSCPLFNLDLATNQQFNRATNQRSDLDCAKQPTYIGAVFKLRPTAHARLKPTVIGRKSPVTPVTPVSAGLRIAPACNPPHLGARPELGP